MAVMIDWLTKDSNYSRWHGGDKQNGTTKMGIANEISQIMKHKGVTTERIGRDIHVKINHLEQQFRTAKDWLNQTGVGVMCEESIKAAVKHSCTYYYELVDVMSDRASSTPLSTISSISPLEILDGDDSKADEVDGNKPIEVDTSKLTIEDVPTLKRKLRVSPSSLLSDLTKLSQLKREQMIDDKKYTIMQLGIEERKLKLLEQSSTIKMEKLKAEADQEHLNVEKE